MGATADGRRARGELSRAAILEAALTIVADSGIPALTHRSVAVEAGVSPALVTYHFASSEQLRQQTLTFAADRVGATLEDLLNAAPSARDVPQVAAELARRLDGEMRRECRALFELMVTATRDPSLHPVVRRFTGHLADLIQPLSGDRERALDASSAFLGTILTHIASGADKSTLGLRITRVITHFDPLRDSPVG